jgi:hypothetical protein
MIWQYRMLWIVGNPSTQKHMALPVMTVGTVSSELPILRVGQRPQLVVENTLHDMSIMGLLAGLL